jgi:hypothetical protein
MGATLPLSVLRCQPQQGVPLDRGNKFAANALAIVSAGCDINYATGAPLVRGFSGYQKQVFPAGQAWSTRKNFYVETETLPAINGPFVEFWYGYPFSDLYAQSGGSSTHNPGMGVGSGSAQLGIAIQVGAGCWGDQRRFLGLHLQLGEYQSGQQWGQSRARG